MSQHVPMTYQAFGLTLQSALPLPELREAGSVDDDADVVVLPSAAPRPTQGVVVDGRDFCVGPDLFWLHVDGVVRLLVRGGREILVERSPGARDGDVRAYLLGSAMGALLFQRGWLPLHASAVEISGRAVAFTAASGRGKSTMAMHLHQRGYPVLCDDICAIDMQSPVPRLWPGLRNLKLWGASLEVIQRGSHDLEPVAVGLDKFRLPLADLSHYRPYDLAAVVLLDWGETTALMAMTGAEGMATLMANTYRGKLVMPMGLGPAHWQQCLATIHAVPVHRLIRPRSLDGLDAASDAVLELTLALAAVSP